ncbi:type VII secretion integral membrane protein EccD [Mumia sp. zg.B53]|uniref:type VII secretion integral membrane protein EccD n=1 Tax=Mumia sp. zg.B53 TaxID=2855449 RepID=UPI001C6DDF6B|nr:type VII secretion integral membrane protein EccD [Mumia sp. zg.B53]MBW9213433.1 type VII secretion integral membrane protein EccD [Mumia sp. zg.B53]
MLTAYSRVTVVTEERRVDLALPSALPLADVVAQVIRYCGGGEAPQAGLALARVGGSPLGLGQTLEEAGVLDGDVLELRPRSSGVEPASVEDVRDAVEDATESAGGAWTPTTTLTFTVVTTAVALGVLALWALGLLERLVPGWQVPPAGAVAAGGIASAVALAALSGWAARAAAPWSVRPVLVAALVWAYVGSTALGSWADWSGSLTVVVAFAMAAAVAGLGRAMTPLATPYLAFAGVLLVVAGAFALTDAFAVEPLQTLRVVVVVVLLAVGVAPRVSLSVGGLASADYRVRNVGTMSREAIQARYRESNGLLVGSLAAIALVAGVGGAVLTFSDGRWERWLALAVGLLALSRSRIFSRVAHMLPLRIAGLVVLGAQLVREVAEVDATRWLVVIVLALGVVAVAVASVQISGISRARVKRLLNLVELLLVIQAIVLACGATGLFDRLSSMV